MSKDRPTGLRHRSRRAGRPGLLQGEAASTAVWTAVQGALHARELGCGAVPARAAELRHRRKFPPHEYPSAERHAAQWSANGGALGATDLTAARRQRLRRQRLHDRRAARAACPSTSSSSCRRRSQSGTPLDPTLADAVAQAMREWAMEKGATHYTHWFQPLTGPDRREARLLLQPDRRRPRDRRVLGQGAHPGRARRVVVPDGRHPRDVRGPRLHRVGPDVAGVHPREPQRHVPVHPDGVRVVDGRGAGPQDPAAALDGRAVQERA